MQKPELYDKEPSTDTSDDSPIKDRCVSPNSTKRSVETLSDEKYAQKKCKRKMILSTIKNKVKISNILDYVIEKWALTGDITKFSEVYKIKGILGEGGFGIVLAVHNKIEDCTSALKIWLKSEQALVINEEANVLSSFDHPNIIKCRRSYETNSRFLMELEYWRGGHLRKMLSRSKNGKFSEEKVHTVMKNLMNAVFYVHSKDYIHRDIKPENILFTDKHDLNSLRLIDFGLSAVYPGMINEEISDKVGTLLFMAPEQTDYTSYTKKVDIWACGIIMYFMLTGKHPYHTKGDTKTSYMAKLNKQEDLILPENLEVSDMWRDFFSRLCKYSPLQRYHSRTAMEHPWIIGDHNAALPLTLYDQLN